MRQEKQLFQHYAAEEHEFVEKMIDLCEQVDQTFAYQLTSFVNPRQVEILKNIVAYFGLTFYSSGQQLDTEYVRVIVAPDYYELDVTDFELQVLEIDYPRKFHQLHHSQILGTLLNQLGIRREFIGDIQVGEDHTYVLLDKKFALLTASTVAKISRVPVKWQERTFSEVIWGTESDAMMREILVSSQRLDKLVSIIFKLSRSQAVKMIEAGHVKVNYVETKQVQKVIDTGQLISVRGYGRAKITAFLGYSKQGKLKLEIELIKK